MLGVIWDQLDGRLQIIQHQLVHMLQIKLQDAFSDLDRSIASAEPPLFKSLQAVVRKRGPVRRVRYAIQIQNSLKKTIEEVKKWAGLFDPSWLLVARLDQRHQFHTPESSGLEPNGTVYTMMEQLGFPSSKDLSTEIPVLLPAEPLKTKQIPYSTVREVEEPRPGLLIDTRHYSYDSPNDSQWATDDVCLLARALQRVDPVVTALLQCKGVVETANKENGSLQFDFIFRIPEKMSQPRGFRDILQTIPTISHSLNERLQLAKSLARSVAFLHSIRFVHKNISPDTCIVLQDGVSALGTPFLVGFDRFRRVIRQTLRAGDDSWSKNLYRHPSRQGMNPEENYIMQHDIYSLGVCLLEIGLWTSFVLTEAEDEEAEMGPILAARRIATAKDRKMRPAETKAILIQTAKELLPPVIGIKFTDVVLACLTCLDREDNTFGEGGEFKDEDGIFVGTRYVEKVWYACSAPKVQLI